MPNCSDELDNLGLNAFILAMKNAYNSFTRYRCFREPNDRLGWELTDARSTERPCSTKQRASMFFMALIDVLQPDTSPIVRDIAEHSLVGLAKSLPDEILRRKAVDDCFSHRGKFAFEDNMIGSKTTTKNAADELRHIKGIGFNVEIVDQDSSDHQGVCGALPVQIFLLFAEDAISIDVGELHKHMRSGQKRVIGKVGTH
jgi:hypothetical protein